MIHVTLRFYGDLNHLLTKEQEGKIIERRLPGRTSVKDLIEGCGVPHTEVDLILTDGQAVDFSYLIADKDHFSVYPVFTALDISRDQRLQEPTLADPRFLADVNLGKLARYLRIAGFDTAYRNDAEDDELIGRMQAEKRVLLTRDRKLLMRKVVRRGYLPRSDDATEQLEEVLSRFQLVDEINAFSRCPRCNGLLRSVPKEQVLDRLKPLTKRYFDTFSQCRDCGQIYWPGSHQHRLKTRLQNILDR